MILNQLIDTTKTFTNACVQQHLAPLMFNAKLFTASAKVKGQSQVKHANVSFVAIVQLWNLNFLFGGVIVNKLAPTGKLSPQPWNAQSLRFIDQP